MTQSCVAWFTGLSGSGKTTIADLAATRLTNRGIRVHVLDGDAVRSSAHRHLGFSPADIRENNRLLAELCRKALVEHDVVLVPVISPFRDARADARRTLGEAFVEVYVKASIAEVVRRDPKGLYRRAQSGEIRGFIGMAPDVPYEPPERPDLVLDTERQDPDACASLLVDFLFRRRTTT